MQPRPGVELKEKEDLIRVALTPGQPKSLDSWFHRGWHTSAEFETLPTLTKPVPVKKPRFHTPGDNTADEGIAGPLARG